jgi:hypothetical protein
VPLHDRAVFVVVLHASPQPLQLLVVVIDSSHPSLCLFTSQSPKPLAHAPLHTLPPHVREAMLFAEQTVPQPPQLFGSVDVVISQPSLCLLVSQSAVPAMQFPLHTPPPHVRVAMLLFEQTVPHPPQLFGSVPVAISHPFVFLLASQSVKPAVQVPLQTPPPHVRVAMLLFEQEDPHVPQLFGSVAVLISQPFVCLLASQSVVPATHVPLQTPPEHVRDAMLLPEHTMPHPPQLFGSLAMSTLQPFICLVPSQFVDPAAHVPLQRPLEQVRVGMLLPEQTMPQPPQLFGSLDVLTLQPFICFVLSQFALPATHVPLHAPAAHVRVAMLLFEQMTPQVPQLFGSVADAISQPSVCLLLLQSEKPAAHVPLQTPAPHVRVDMWLFEHETPHPPQLFGSVCLSWHVELQHVVAVPPSPPHALPHMPQLKLSSEVSMHVLPQHAIGPAPASLTPPSGKQSAMFRQPSAHVYIPTPCCTHRVPTAQLSFNGKHGTHWKVATSQRGFVPEQSLSCKHCRHTPASMSQSPAPPSVARQVG